MDRTVDEHNFALVLRHSRRSSCRIQIFEAVDQRPVAIATQAMPPGGASLTNAAEQFATAVWQEYLPHSDEPPRWIEHYEPDPDQLDQGRPHWLEVEFVVEPDQHLTSPTWRSCDSAELAELVGGPIDPRRGNYTPAPSAPPERFTLVLVPVLRLPRPHPFRAKTCMASGSGTMHRYWRRLNPRRGPRDCCWYHAGDWRNVMRRIAEMLGPDARSGVEIDDDTRRAIVKQLPRLLSTEWEAEAASSLLLDPMAAEDDRWLNGQHRAQAMIDVGCRHALLERLQADSDPA